MRQIGPSSRRVPAWLPYLESVSLRRGGVTEWVYNGGVLTTDLSDISTILVYGDSKAQIPLPVLDLVGRKGIPIVLHRRNMGRAIYIAPGPRPDPEDTLTTQLTRRTQSRTSSHVARQLLAAKMRGMSWLVDPVELPQYADVDALRHLEMGHARGYWASWFEHLGEPTWTRRGHNPAAASLDSVSTFVSGIVMRWVIYHHLSPYHGFMHTPTDYPSLVYDLMEPYRGLIERELLTALVQQKPDAEQWVPFGIEVAKTWLNTQTYVPLTRQIVTHQELFHGAVLSLKKYLAGETRKFHVPFPGPVQGGRPPKVDFVLSGRQAGRTDFWDRARAVAPPAQVDTDPTSRS